MKAARETGQEKESNDGHATATTRHYRSGGALCSDNARTTRHGARHDAGRRPGRGHLTLLGSGQPSLVPGHELSLRRVTIAPGGGIPAHTHPGALVIFLESGSWGYIPLGG